MVCRSGTRVSFTSPSLLPPPHPFVICRVPSLVIVMFTLFLLLCSLFLLLYSLTCYYYVPCHVTVMFSVLFSLLLCSLFPIMFSLLLLCHCLIVMFSLLLLYSLSCCYVPCLFIVYVPSPVIVMKFVFLRLYFCNLTQNTILSFSARAVALIRRIFKSRRAMVTLYHHHAPCGVGGGGGLIYLILLHIMFF